MVAGLRHYLRDSTLFGTSYVWAYIVEALGSRLNIQNWRFKAYEGQGHRLLSFSYWFLVLIRHFISQEVYIQIIHYQNTLLYPSMDFHITLYNVFLLRVDLIISLRALWQSHSTVFSWMEGVWRTFGIQFAIKEDAIRQPGPFWNSNRCGLLKFLFFSLSRDSCIRAHKEPLCTKWWFFFLCFFACSNLSNTYKLLSKLSVEASFFSYSILAPVLTKLTHNCRFTSVTIY